MKRLSELDSSIFYDRHIGNTEMLSSYDMLHCSDKPGLLLCAELYDLRSSSPGYHYKDLSGLLKDRNQKLANINACKAPLNLGISRALGLWPGMGTENW